MLDFTKVTATSGPFYWGAGTRGFPSARLSG